MIDFELTGSTAAVEAIAQAIRRIGTQAFKRELLEAMADEAIRLVREEFVVSRDPYGNPWAPLKRPRKDLGAGPLVKTGRLQGSVRPRILGDGFNLRAAAPYAQFHQKGTRNMVARPIFPADQQLPPTWWAHFERIADEALQRALSRAA